MTNREFAITASLISGKTGVRAVQQMEYAWSADVEEGIIYYPYKPFYTDEDIGFLLHEAAHIRFSGISHGATDGVKDWIEKTGKAGEQIFSLVNALEDIRIEKKIQDVYSGAFYYLDLANSYAWERMTSQIDYHLYINDEYYEKMQSKRWLHFNGFFLFSHHSGRKKGEEYLDLWNPDQTVYDAIIASETSVSKIYSCKSTDDVIKLIQDEILVHYLPLCDDKDKSEEEQKESLKELLELLKEFLGLIKKLKKESEEKKKKGEGTKVKIASGETPQKIDEGDLTEKLFDEDRQHRDTTRTVFSPKSEQEIFRTKREAGALTVEQLNREVNNSLTKTKQAVSIIKDLEVSRFTGGFTSGKVENRKLFKLKTGTNRIFSRKTEVNLDDKDMVFGVLVDESGSMSHWGDRVDPSSPFSRTKDQDACIATTILSKALESAGKRHTVVGFNEFLRTHKEFNEKLNLQKMLEIEANASGYGSGDNCDGYAVQQMKETLLRQPERNKIMIVLSDGYPAPCYEHRNIDLEQEVKLAERAGIKVYGIGVSSDAVRKYYSRHVVINDTSQLGVELAKIFKTHVGHRVR